MCTFINEGKVVTTPSYHCTIKVLSGDWIMFGFLNPNEFVTNGLGFDTLDGYNLGYFYYGAGGELYSLQGQGVVFPDPSHHDVVTYTHPGTIVGVYYDVENGQIGYHINGRDVGIAFENVTDKDLHPTIIISGTAQFEIVETPKQFVMKHPRNSRKSKLKE